MKIEFLTSLYRIRLELVTQWNLDPDNSCKYLFFKYIFFATCIYIYRQHVYKFCQRNLFFSEVPKVDSSGFGNELFNIITKNQTSKTHTHTHTHTHTQTHTHTHTHCFIKKILPSLIRVHVHVHLDHIS